MRLFEFADDDPLRVKLTAVVSQLKSEMEHKGEKEPMPTDEFLNILKKNEIYVDKSDLFDMVKSDPLKNIVSNISSHQVTFKGMPGTEKDDSQGPDNFEKIRQQMATKQANKKPKLAV